MNFTKNKFGILYVDDEEKSLKYFTEAFDDLAPIYTANCADEGLKVFQQHINEIGVVLSDKKMPGISGIEFLKQVRQIDEEPLRMLVTAHTDLKLAVEALNDGLLYSYLTKPWDPFDLKSRLGRALDRFWITKERNKLLKERAAVFQEMMAEEKASNIYTLSIGLNHHMKNALLAIQAYFDMIPVQLDDELSGMPKDSFFWDTYYKNIDEQISRVLEILSNLAGGTGGVDSPGEDLVHDIDLVEIIERIAKQELGGDLPVEFILTKMDEIGKFTGNSAKISSMIQYLIRESVKNVEGKGKIEFQLFNTRRDGVEAVRVRCVDDGKPIPDEVRAHLFDPFYVRPDRPSETGTGLLYCYLTVFQHGGKIEASGLSDNRNVIEILLPKSPVRNVREEFPYKENGA